MVGDEEELSKGCHNDWIQ